MNIIQVLRQYNSKSMERRGINLAPLLLALSLLAWRWRGAGGGTNVWGKLQLDDDSGSTPEPLLMEVFTSSPFLSALYFICYSLAEKTGSSGFQHLRNSRLGLIKSTVRTGESIQSGRAE